MKARIFVFISICLIVICNTYAQYVPNGEFENWEDRILYEDPEWWNTVNQEAFMYDTASALPTTDAYSGMYSLRIETVVTDDDTLFGYAFCNGSVIGGSLEDILVFSGGIPISGAPDSLLGYFKYEIAANDTGIVLVSFKENGTVISQNIYPITESQSTYVKKGWEIPAMAGTPDTVLIAFACTNPDDVKTGGWMQLDSLWFGGITDTIPNNEFERWEEASYFDPENWVSANLFAFMFGGDTVVKQTDDAYGGDYAMRIESKEMMIPTDLGFINAVVGFAIPYTSTYNFFEELPTFELDFNPSALIGYYKFQPLLNDTAFAYINLFDDAGNPYEFGWFLTETDEYTYFEVPLDYPDGVTITEASVVMSTTIYFMQGDAGSGEVGSILFLDDLDLINPCDTFPLFEIAEVTLPTCEDSSAVIDAGAGWDEYLWSNDETTQAITVEITENTTYSVVVTNTETGCEFSDTVTIDAPTGCPDPCDAFDPYEIADVTQPTCEDITAVIDAGDGWDEYLWSNDETTQVISVEITENSTFSVTVTDTDTGCEFSDEVTINAPTGCESSIEYLSDKTFHIELYRILRLAWLF